MSVIVSFAPGPEGEAALAEAARQSATLGCPLTLVCAVATQEARQAARAAAEPFADARVLEVAQGQDAVEVIVEEILREEHALLVIGLRRRTPVGKLILGSSAQRLLLDAPCPVLAVKP